MPLELARYMCLVTDENLPVPDNTRGGIGTGRTKYRPQGVLMKKEISVFLLLFLFLLLTLFLLLFSAVEGSAQTKSYITIRGSELNNGVVILDVVKAGKTYRMQCNVGAAGCTTLKDGKYLMLELPENFGMYECKDVEVYPEAAVDPREGERQETG